MLKELETAFGSKDQRLQDSQGHYNVFNLNCTASTAGMASPVACGHLASAGAFTQQSLRAAQRLRDQPKPHLRALVRSSYLVFAWTASTRSEFKQNRNAVLQGTSCKTFPRSLQSSKASSHSTFDGN